MKVSGFIKKLKRNREIGLTPLATGMKVCGSREANEGNWDERAFILFQRVIWDMRHLLASVT